MPRPRNDFMHRAHADDLAERPGHRTRAAPKKFTDGALRGEELACEVHVHHGIPVGERHVDELRVLLQVGIRDHDIHRAETLDQRVEHGIDIGFVRDVGLDRDGLAACFFYRCRERFSGFAMRVIVDDDARAGIGERLRHAVPYAGTAAGDECDLTFEYWIHSVPGWDAKLAMRAGW